MGRTYLYGIIGSGDAATLGIAGVDGASPVYTIVRDGLSCVVSPYQGPEIGGLSKEELVRRLLAHQQVIEHVMRDGTVLPVKFGTVLQDPREVFDLLSQGHAALAQALCLVQEKIEIEVAATWDTSRVLQEISTEEEVVRAREAIARKGQPTVEDRVHLGQMVKGCMDRRRASYRQRMVGLLQPLALDAVTNALLSEAMVMNVAFLIERGRQQEFEERLQQLDALFQSEITFRMIGPLPPYSFSTVAITRVTPEQLREARETLGLRLGGTISEAEVRRAYRRLAAETQRHQSPGEEQAQARFARLREAAALLLQCCQGQGKARGKGQGPSRRGSEGGCTFLIACERSGGEEIASSRFGKGERAQMAP